MTSFSACTAFGQATADDCCNTYIYRNGEKPKLSNVSSFNRDIFICEGYFVTLKATKSMSIKILSMVMVILRIKAGIKLIIIMIASLLVTDSVRLCDTNQLKMSPLFTHCGDHSLTTKCMFANYRKYDRN